ncbi:methyltransferase domain-containing protein [Nocardia sp. CDC159]|uniref:Methyltransferase domain-containing protein n=1 Tax=Nocardia pulmonis TaxID=2951408 RepID=A0A9X2IZK0_9NOCA|nr:MULTISPECIES: methyltransferase domain-containing protein [Nocardia]MCM6778147.1 methyltransferase domain-containing protein [Nocardia pulmonis]MCM6791036.1 methyltransferase domain-containing protein [Nocardia sp. CDC159]
MNPVAARVMSTLAGQLGNPHGVLGKGVALLLNRSNRGLIEAAVAAAEVGAGQAAADIGFGGGVGLSLLLDRVGAQGTVYGVEISPDMLARARSRLAPEIGTARLRLLAGSLADLPLADAALDAVITVNTLYFVSDLGPVAAELARVLRPGGRAVIGIGDPADMARMPFTRSGFQLRPPDSIAAALERAGLTVEQRAVANRPITGHLLIARR